MENKTIKVGRHAGVEGAKRLMKLAREGSSIVIHSAATQDVVKTVLDYAPVGAVVLLPGGDTIIIGGTKEEKDMNKETVVKPSKLAFGKEAFVTGVKKVFKKESKEESTMTNKFNYKKAVSTTWNTIKKGANKVVSFVKKHAIKATLGLGAVTLAGTFTSGLLSALLVGTGIYALLATVYEFIKAKRAKRELDKEALSSHLGDALLYGTVGALFMYFLAGLLVSLLANLFVYAYVGFSYMSYFIVA